MTEKLQNKKQRKFSQYFLTVAILSSSLFVGTFERHAHVSEALAIDVNVNKSTDMRFRRLKQLRKVERSNHDRRKTKVRKTPASRKPPISKSERNSAKNPFRVSKPSKIKIRMKTGIDRRDKNKSLTMSSNDKLYQTRVNRKRLAASNSAASNSAASNSAASNSAARLSPLSIPNASNKKNRNTVTASQGTQLLASANSPLNEFIMLSVDKSTMNAELRTWPSDSTKSKLLKTYRFAMGKAQGDKLKEGDNKTPEGIYFAQKHIPGSKLLQKKYGPWAIPIDFPNPIDRLEGKTGYGIWLHGAGNDERIARTNVTEGCIAFYNKDITKLSSWLEPHQAMVVIADNISSVNKPTELAKVKARTQQWIEAWRARNVEDYISYYSDKFTLKGLQKSSYAKYKKRIFSSYNKMLVGISDLRVVTHPKYALSIMNQDFNGDGRYVSKGRKILFWSKSSDGQWKIVREIFNTERMTPIRFGARELQRLRSDEARATGPKSLSMSTTTKS